MIYGRLSVLIVGPHSDNPKSIHLFLHPPVYPATYPSNDQYITHPTIHPAISGYNDMVDRNRILIKIHMNVLFSLVVFMNK